MKRYILVILAVYFMGLTACYDDNSTLAGDQSGLQNIVIGDLKDTAVISYTSVLKITPAVSGLPENELTYAWYIYGGEFSDKKENGYRTHKIGTEKTLEYEVKLKQGNYKLVFEATSAKYGYAALKELSLEVYTSFSQGFYILKETADGNTDLDLYHTGTKQLTSNVLTLTQGEPLPGAPRCLNMVYNKVYADPETAKPGNMITAFVAYGENGMACYRTEDMLKIFDRSSLLFGEMEEDEIPYSMATVAYANLYFSSKGVRSEDNSENTYATGKMGFPDGDGGSTFIQACDGSGMLYWDGQNHSLMYSNDYGIVEEVYLDDVDFYFGDKEAIATGWNYLGETNTVWYLFEDPSGQRYLVFVDEGHFVTEIRILDPDLHISRANVVAGNGKTAYTIYVADGNQMYSYNIDDDTETPMRPEGLPSEGKITFVSDIYFSTPDAFDYIVIGIQNGEEYLLYMYEILGGLPDGAPAHSLKGKGKLKEVRYVSGTAVDAPNLYPFESVGSQDFPY